VRLTLDDLPLLDRTELVAAWEGIFGRSPPRNISQRMMRMFIAFEIQSRSSSGLKPSVKRRLAQIRQGKEEKAAPANTLEPGARLVREWNGVSHVVDVTEDGIVWNGQRYSSLTAVSQAITGTHWSGPRFFGLSK